MTAVGEAFANAFGTPSPSVPVGVRFSGSSSQRLWQTISQDTGAGWYRNGFLFLFGEGLDALQPCLDAWRFLVGENANRQIIGRNAYGAILVLENAESPADQRVHVLDPFTVTYETNPNLMFVNLIGRWLPRNELGQFLDDEAYREWLHQNEVASLDFDDVLGFKVPQALGGSLTADNLQLDGIVEYYRTTGPIYAEAFKREG